MDFKQEMPIIVFDNQCYLCVKFAKMINFLSVKKFTMIGHHTVLGQTIRREMLDDSALDMFWVIDEKNAFGGRAALLPLLKKMLFSKRKKSTQMFIDDTCEQGCKTAKSVLLRSVSLLSNSKKIDL